MGNEPDEEQTEALCDFLVNIGGLLDHADKRQLIRIAKHLKVGLNPKPLELLERDIDEEVDLTFFTYYPFRCVLCGKCVYVCRKKNGHNILTFAERGFDTVIAFFGTGDPADFPCQRCGACAAICPTGALVPKSEYTEAVG